MNSSEFKRIGRTLKVIYGEVKKEAVKKGASIDSPEYHELINIVREKVLGRLGYTNDEYREAKEAVQKEREENLV